MIRLICWLVCFGLTAACAQSQQMNLYLRSDFSFRYWGMQQTHNVWPGSGGQAAIPLQGGAASYSTGVEIGLPFAIAGLSWAYPGGGNVASLGGGSTYTCNLHQMIGYAGPGLMTNDGIGIFAGWQWGFHQFSFAPLQTSGTEIIGYEAFEGAGSGWFATAMFPLLEFIQLRADLNRGNIRDTYSNIKANYQEFSGRIFFHLEDRPESGIYLKAGTYRYHLPLAGHPDCRIGGTIWQIGINYIPNNWCF